MLSFFKRHPSYFFVFSIVGVLAACIGFAKTFFLPMASGTFAAPWGVHVHGAFAFAWIFLFLIQNALIHVRNYRLHRSLSFIGLFIAIGVAVTMVPAGLFVVERELKQGLGATAYSGLLGVITSGLIFLALVMAGILSRNRPDYHKRYMLLATIVVLWPAWFRFRHYFPSVPHPEIWFALVLADSLIVSAWIWEKVRYGKIHPVLIYVGLFIIVEQSFEVVSFDSGWWRVIARWCYNFAQL